MNRYPMGPTVCSPHTIMYFESESTEPHHPVTLKTCVSLRVAGLAKVAYYTDKCPVQFSIWPVEDSKESSWTSISFLVSVSHLFKWYNTGTQHLIIYSVLFYTPFMPWRQLCSCLTNSAMPAEWPCRAARCTGVIPLWKTTAKLNRVFFTFNTYVQNGLSHENEGGYIALPTLELMRHSL